MRLRYVTLLLLLLVLAGSATSSNHSRRGTVSRPLRHEKRGVVDETARRLLDTEVPDRLRKWSIFQDGNTVRESVRKGYIWALRKADRLHSPYSDFRGIRKEWHYVPDLRKHYFVPRVLRIPAVLQKSPIPNEEPFKAFVKDLDKGSGLKDAAKKHIPDLDKEEEEEEAKKAASLQASASPPEEPALSERRGRRRSFKRRKRPANRDNSFHHFKPTSGSEEETAPYSPVNEIRPATPPSAPETGASELAPTVDNAAQGPSKAAEQTQRSSSAVKLDKALLQMTEKYEALQRFKARQIEKASIRYPGHPEYRPPAQQPQPQQEEVPVKVEPGAGLAPIRTRISASQEVTPDDTPRRVDDPRGAEADVSTSSTPHDWASYFGKNGARPGSRGSSGLTTPTYTPFSPYVSTPGGTSPGSVSDYSARTVTPRTPTQPATGTAYQLPANYAELLHMARLQRGKGVEQTYSSAFRPVAHQWSSVQYSPGHPAYMSWNGGRPSHKGLRELYEAAELNDVGHVIYDDDTAGREGLGASGFEKVHPVDGDGRAAQLLPSSSKRKAASDAETSGAEAEHPVQPARNGPSENVEEQAPQQLPHTEALPPASSHTLPTDAETQDTVAHNDKLESQASSPERSTEAEKLDDAAAAAKKSKRPRPLVTKTLDKFGSFFFPTPRGSGSGKDKDASPDMVGFKHSLKVPADGDAAALSKVPADGDAAASPKLSPGRQSFKETVVSLKDTLKRIVTLGSPDSTMRASREQRQMKQIRELHQSNPEAFVI